MSFYGWMLGSFCLGAWLATWWIEKHMPPSPDDRISAWYLERWVIAESRRAGKLTPEENGQATKRIEEFVNWQQANARAQELVPEASEMWTKRLKELEKWLRTEARTKALAETVAEDKRLEDERRNQPVDVAHQRAALLVLAIVIGGMGLVLWIHS